MATYQIETTNGVFEIETEDPKQVDRNSPEYLASVDPKALALQEMSKGKFIPQMTKAMYEGLPFGKRAIALMPNAEELQRNIEATPEAQGFKAGAGRFVGDIVAMAPAIAGAEAIIPARLLAASVGVGLQRGGQSLSEGASATQAGIEALISGGTTMAGGKALEGAGKYIARKIPSRVLNPLRPTEDEISKESIKVIKEGVNKAIRPSVVGKGSAVQQESYYKRAESAVNDIIENKDNIEIVDAAGNIITGKSPKSLNEMLQAVGQTKESIFNKYAPMIEDASNKGAKVDGNAIAAKLRDFSAQEDVQMANPELAKYASDVAARWQDKSIPLTTAENVAKRFNAMLKQKYQQGKITGADVSSAHVDDMVVRMLRNDIADKAGVGELKARYGALAGLESDLAKRVIVAGRQNQVGLVESMANLQSGADIAGGLALAAATGNPAYMGFALRGLGAKVTGNVIKSLNSPDVNIARMFKKIETLRSTPVRTEPTVSKLKELLKTATPEERRVIKSGLKGSGNPSEVKTGGQAETSKDIGRAGEKRIIQRGSKPIKREGLRGNKGEAVISRASDNPLNYKTAEEYANINLSPLEKKALEYSNIEDFIKSDNMGLVSIKNANIDPNNVKLSGGDTEKTALQRSLSMVPIKDVKRIPILKITSDGTLQVYDGNARTIAHRNQKEMIKDFILNTKASDKGQLENIFNKAKQTKSQLTAEWQAAQKGRPIKRSSK